MKRQSLLHLTVSFVVGLMLISFDIQNLAKTQDNLITRHLAFQVFTSAPSPSIPPGGDGAEPLSSPPSKSTLKQFVQAIINEIGMTGDSQNKLAFIIGPLAFDHTDLQLRQMIQDAFDIALELDIAVGFHLDDSMFWARRPDLWQDPQNVEWLDWEGTPNTGRRIDWSAQPTKLAPQMCFNSAAIQSEVNRISTDIIGSTIAEGVQKLEAQEKPELFAGVVVGWETQIGRDFDTDQALGYCALSNRGFSQDKPPQDLDAEREKAVQAFIELWANGIKQAGVDPAKIYAHTALVSQTTFQQMDDPNLTYSQANNFAPPDVSFSENYQPGFSTYPQSGLMEQLYSEFEKYGNPSWASAKGSIVAPAMLESVVDTETYLAWMFNHGAALVNIFGWGVGTKDENPFWKAADNPDAISAYRKFLSGSPLVESMTDLSATISGSLPDKIQRIQTDLPAWIQNHPDKQSEAETLVQQLDEALKAGNLQDAQALVDVILNLIAQ